MGLHWNYIAIVFVFYCDCIATVLKSKWERIGNVLGMHYDCIGIALDCIGIGVGMKWDGIVICIWTVLGLCWDCIGGSAGIVLGLLGMLF